MAIAMEVKECYDGIGLAMNKLNAAQIQSLSPGSVLQIAAQQGIIQMLADLRHQNNIIIHLLSGGKLEDLEKPKEEPQINKAPKETELTVLK
jgi:hypothetical protein